jgi:hypothetical protein
VQEVRPQHVAEDRTGAGMSQERRDRISQEGQAHHQANALRQRVVTKDGDGPDRDQGGGYRDVAGHPEDLHCSALNRYRTFGAI